MKKKLEAELISIAHRILKLKNRSELDQLQQETLRLYEKISVLRFVEDNFNDVKPTIGYASAEEKLEDIYGIEDVPPVHANEQEAKEDKAREEKKEQKSEAESKKAKEQPKAEEEKPEDTAEEPEAKQKPEGDADPEQDIEEYEASEEEKEHTEEETDEDVKEPEAEEKAQAKSEEPKAEQNDDAGAEEQSDDAEDEQEDAEPVKEEPQPEAQEEKEPEVGHEEPANDKKVEVVKPEEEVKAMEASAKAVYKKEDESTPEEEEKAADAEIKTIEPDKDTKTDEVKLDFGFAFERKPAPEENTKQKEITFEDYANYKEPEFVKKGEEPKTIQQEFLPKEPEVARKQDDNADALSASQSKQEDDAPARDWRDWEPSTSPYADKKEEPKAESQPKAEDKPQTGNLNLKTITLGLNDRIAFEKNLFGGSGEDLNRVISQLNTMDRFEDAKDFINDLVKPDYNNWEGKEEYEERLMQLVEKRFS